MRLPDAESRQVVLERGHKPPIEISYDEETPADAQATWLAQRRVVVAVEQGEASSSDSDEFHPGWTAEESEGSGDEQVFAAQAGQ
eukprot:15433423-Alexandrium_andersonii.AAC.1